MTTQDQQLIKKMARAMTFALGRDYSYDRETKIPYWYFSIEWALRHIAATKVLDGDDAKPAPPSGQSASGQSASLTNEIGSKP